MKALLGVRTTGRYTDQEEDAGGIGTGEVPSKQLASVLSL